MEVFKAHKHTTTVRQATAIELDAHQVVFYNTGETTVFVDGVPVLSGGTYTEGDYAILVHYQDRINIHFEGAGKNELLIIQKKYYL